MTYNMQPVTGGYGSIVDKNPFGVLGNVPNWENTAHTRFAGDAIRHITKNVEQENYFKAQKELMQPQQSQGFGLSQGLDLATNLFGAFSGGFGDGGFWGGGTTGPSAPEAGVPIYGSGSPWNGPIFGTPGSMHRI